MKFFIRARHSPQKIRDQSFDGVVRRNGGFSKLITKIGVARGNRSGSRISAWLKLIPRNVAGIAASRWFKQRHPSMNTIRAL
jgi:hypothetical protein